MTPEELDAALAHVSNELTKLRLTVDKTLHEKARNSHNAEDMMQVSYLAGKREGIREASNLVAHLWAQHLHLKESA